MTQNHTNFNLESQIADCNKCIDLNSGFKSTIIQIEKRKYMTKNIRLRKIPYNFNLTYLLIRKITKIHTILKYALNN